MRATLLDARRPGDVVEVAEQLSAVKIDPTATIAPCEHAMLWTRIGAGYDPALLTRATQDGLVVEHDGAFRPASLLPALVPVLRGRELRQATRDWLAANDAFRRDVLARLEAEGPLAASGIPDTAAVARPDEAGWYGPNQVPRMLELLSLLGVVAVCGRRGRTRLWDLAERVWPAEAFAGGLDREEGARVLAERRLEAAGVARQRSPWSGVGEAGLPARVEGSAWRWRVSPQALASLDEPFEGRVAFLNPYDGALFDRPRLKELFGFAYVLEQFKPAAQRRFGYFSYPVLDGHRFVGLLDAAVERDAPVLRVAAIHELVPFDDALRERVDAQVRALAAWLDVDVRHGAEPYP